MVPTTLAEKREGGGVWLAAWLAVLKKDPRLTAPESLLQNTLKNDTLTLTDGGLTAKDALCLA